VNLLRFIDHFYDSQNLGLLYNSSWPTAYGKSHCTSADKALAVIEPSTYIFYREPITSYFNNLDVVVMVLGAG